MNKIRTSKTLKMTLMMIYKNNMRENSHKVVRGQCKDQRTSGQSIMMKLITAIIIALKGIKDQRQPK